MHGIGFVWTPCHASASDAGAGLGVRMTTVQGSRGRPSGRSCVLAFLCLEAWNCEGCRSQGRLAGCAGIGALPSGYAVAGSCRETDEREECIRNSPYYKWVCSATRHRNCLTGGQSAGDRGIRTLRSGFRLKVRFPCFFSSRTRRIFRYPPLFFYGFRLEMQGVRGDRELDMRLY